MRVKTSPKISSQSAGWTARVSRSVGSWRNFCASNPTMVKVFSMKLRRGASGCASRGNVSLPVREVLAESPRSAAGACSFTVTSSRFQGIACIVGKHSIQCYVIPSHRRLQFGGSSHCYHLAQVHDRNPVAEAVGLLHIVCGQK